MQQQQLVWLVGALVLLLGIAFLAGSFDSEISTIDVPRLGIPSEDIELINIEQNDSTSISINRTENGWQLTSPVQARADSITLARFTQNLGDLSFETVVSSNPDRYSTYGVQDGAQTVSLSWADTEKTLMVGNAGPDFQSIYVRLADDPRVFLTKGRINLPANLDSWRDKVLLNIQPQQLNKIVVTGPDESFEASYTGFSWQISPEDDDEVEGDSTKVVQWLNRFSPIRAIGFLDDKPASEVKAEATHQIHFSTSAGRTHTLWFLELENDLAATVNGSNVTYRLSQSMLESFLPSIASLE